MYNRYVPQSDGSFQRSRVPEPVKPPKLAPEPPPKQEPPPIPEPVPEKPPEPPKERPKPCPKSAGSFLKGLLPRNLETEDLMVLLLLLLMTGDENPENSNLLLTLAIYLLL